MDAAKAVGIDTMRDRDNVYVIQGNPIYPPGCSYDPTMDMVIYNRGASANAKCEDTSIANHANTTAKGKTRDQCLCQ